MFFVINASNNEICYKSLLNYDNIFLKASLIKSILTGYSISEGYPISEEYPISEGYLTSINVGAVIWKHKQQTNAGFTDNYQNI